MKKNSRQTQNDKPDGLTHNPFAALRPKGSTEPAAEPSAEPTAEAPTKQPKGPSVRAVGSKHGKVSEPAAGDRLVVRREKRGRAGKTVTRVSGLELDDAALEKLAREMKRALGCGATIEAPDVLLQGALTERAASWLGKRFGVGVTIGN